MTTPPSRPTALYRWYDESGTLLYVGITGSLIDRTSEHGHTDPWWRQVSTCRVEWFETVNEAATAERAAITAEAPVYNRMRPRVRPERIGRPGNRSPLEFMLVQLILREPLPTYIARHRDRGETFDEIAAGLSAFISNGRREAGLEGGVTIGGETIRRWATRPAGWHRPTHPTAAGLA